MAGLGRRIEAVIYAVSGVGSKIAAILLFLMILAIGADVIGRYVFNNAIKGVLDVVELSLLFIIFLTTADVAARKAHIKVDLVTSRLSKGPQTIMHCATSLASLAIVALIAWQMGVRGWTQVLRPTLYTASLEIPIAPFLLVAALGCLILCLVLAIDSASYLSQAWRGKLEH